MIHSEVNLLFTHTEIVWSGEGGQSKRELPKDWYPTCPVRPTAELMNMDTWLIDGVESACRKSNYQSKEEILTYFIN